MTIEIQLAEINAAGFLVTEMYQRHVDEWFVVLRLKGDFSSAHGQGALLSEALASAWSEAHGRKRMTDADWKAVSHPAKKTSIPRIR